MLAELVAAARRRWPAGPGPPEDRHRADPRRCHRRPSGRRCVEAAAKARGRRRHRGGRRLEPPGPRRRARITRRSTGSWPRSPTGSTRRQRVGLAPAVPAPRQLGRHADPAGHPLRPGPARARDLRPVAGAGARDVRAAAGDDGAGTGRADQAGAGRRGRLLRAHVHAPTRGDHAGAGPARVRRRRPAAASSNVGPVLAGRRASGPSPAGSAWTRSCSTAATTRSPAGDVAVLFGPGDDGEPTADDWADATGTINYEIVTRIGSTPGRRAVRTTGRRRDLARTDHARRTGRESDKTSRRRRAGVIGAAGRRRRRRVSPPASPPSGCCCATAPGRRDRDPYADEPFGALPVDEYRTVATDEGIELHVEIVGRPRRPS